MNRQKVLLWILRSTAVFLVAGLVLGYWGVQKNVPAGWISGIVLFVLTGCIALIVKTVMSRPSKKLIARWVGYLTIPDEKPSDHAAELDEVCSNFAKDPDKKKNRVAKPSYSGGGLFCDYSVIDSGKIFYGCLVQANSMLFDISKNAYEALPAVFIYSPDEHYAKSPAELLAIADALYADKENNSLRNETDYEFNTAVDSALTGGKEVYLTDILVARYQLPMGRLGRHRIMPIIADPTRKSSAFVVDSKYWSDKLIAEYIYASEDPPDEYGDPFGV